MSNNREKDLWRELALRDILLGFLAIIIVGGVYFWIDWIKPTQGGWNILGTLVQDIIANLIPVFLLFIGSYALFRHAQRLRSAQETEELASKVAEIVQSKLASREAMIEPSHPVDMPEGQLIIESAKYGATVENIDYYNDVADRVRSAIVAGRVNMRVDNDSFGPDPIKREPKHVTVDYVYAGRDGYSKTVPERATLLLP